MAVALSSLRVGADFDASGYIRGAQQKVDADQRMIAADKARNASLAQADAALGKAIPGVAALSRSLLDGYGAGATFEAQIRKIGNAVDRGLSLDRANTLLDAAYRKFGLTADAVALAEKGFVAIAPAVDAANRRFEAHNELLTRTTVRVEALAAAQRSQAVINSQFGIGANDNTAARGADIAAYGKSLDDLRAKFNPLFAAGRTYKETLADINAAAKVGAISEAERAAALTHTKAAFVDQVNSLRSMKTATSDAAAATGLASYQMTNLGYQVNDVATMLASGASPFQVLATQGGQVYQILGSANAGVGGALKSIGVSLLGIVTPGRLAFAAITTGVGIATTALISYEGKMNEVQRQLTGMGRASGATALGLDAIAQQNSSPAGFSTNEARSLAASLAATGKVGVEAIGPIVALGHDFAKTFGVDAKEATDILTKAFADPVKGADDLNQLLGFLDANTKILIESLVTQGNRTEAVRILTDRIKGSIADASQITSFWARAWTVTANTASDFFDRVGRGADRLFNGGSGLDEKINNLTAELVSLQKAKIEGGFWNWLTTDINADQRIAAITAEIERLRKTKLNQSTPADPETANKQRALEIDAVARATLPTIDATRKLHDETVALQQAFDRPELQKYITLIGTDLVLALNRRKAAEDAMRGADPIKNQIADMESQVRLLDHRTIADRAREAAAAERRRQALDPNAGTEEERLRKQGLAALVAAGGQSALDNVAKMRVGVFGAIPVAAAAGKSQEDSDDRGQRRVPKAA